MKINWKRYKIKDSVIIRLQGICLLLLAYLCYKVKADEVMFIFLLLGMLMVCPDLRRINRCILWIAKKIVRQGHRREY